MNRLAVALALLLAAAPARAGDGGFLHRMTADVRARIAAAIAERAPAPLPPVAIRWKPTKLGSLDLGAPLVAMVGADLDGDRKLELYAVTTREVIAIAADRRLKELGRVAFAGDPAVIEPRDPVGAAIVEAGVVVASASPWQHNLRVHWDKGVLVGEAGTADLAVCPGEHVQLAPGRNYFTTNVYAVRCAGSVRVELPVKGPLVFGGAGIPDAGVAFDLVDLDRDGTPELVYAGAEAPGDPDHVKVMKLGQTKAAYRKPFTAGGIAGIAGGDFDGDRVSEALVAVRLVGATRVDIWRVP